MWPIFFKNSLVVGDPKNNVGICTSWTKKEIFVNQLEKNRYCVIGNLYSIDGINYILKNILANPLINYLIVCGRDLNGSTSALISFFKNGTDQKGKIIGFDGYIHSNIPLDLIRAVRENIQIIDLRGKEKKLPDLLKRISGKGKKFATPVVIPDQKGKEDFISPDLVGFRVEGGLDEVWLRILDLAMKFGEEKESQHELKQKEILDLLAVIKKFSLKPFFGFEKKDVENYTKSFFSERKPQEIEYSYGEKLFKFAFRCVVEGFGGELKFFVNQIEEIVKLLKQYPYSRRIVASLWDPFSDLKSENPPCLTQITWNIKNERLYQTCTFRSHDLFGAYLMNALALRKLQVEIGQKAKIPCGDLIILSQSAHIYQNSWEKVKTILESYYRGKRVKFKEDKAGYFRIWIDAKSQEIVVQHYLRDGRKSKFEFRGKDAVSLYRKILNENLVSLMDHAAYLGKELGKAESALRNREEYCQESA